jgi:hypothetical protein
LAFLSSSREQLRQIVRDDVRTICDATKATIYGSFANDAFHLDIESWVSHSDLDLISPNSQPTKLAAFISAKIFDRLGLTIQTKVRRNSSHIDRLPNSVSRQLAFVDTAIAFTAGVKTQSHFHYLLVKYLLRAFYLDRYLAFDEDMSHRLLQSTNVGDDAFWVLMQFKLEGKNLMPHQFARIVTGLQALDSRHLQDMKALLSLRDINEVIPYWQAFVANASAYELNDLVDDISCKIELAMHCGSSGLGLAFCPK